MLIHINNRSFNENVNNTVSGVSFRSSSNKDEKVLTPSNGNVFIVHGQDELLRRELKDFIQNRLHYSEPIILEENMRSGLTIIENFEQYAKDIAFVFVLLTPDDFVKGALRARQNVIFELGYFMGKLGRKSGRVILLVKGNVEIPSDLHGILYIRADDGINKAAEDIRKAVEAVEVDRFNDNVDSSDMLERME